jgi:mitochondrial fission protein ELM1
MNAQNRKEARLRKALRSVWCVSDGTTGMRQQSLAVAAVMKWYRCADFRDIVINPHPLLRFVPRIGRWWPQLPLTQAGDTSLPRISNADDFPQILVTCGRRMAGISMALKARAKQQGAQLTTLHLQDPRLDPAYFDILIVPHHDPARADNVIVTTAALNRLDQSHIADAATHLPQSWKATAKPRVAVLVGGDNRRYRISEKMAADLASQLRHFAKANDASLFLVPSQRCPDSIWQRLQSELKGINCLIPGKQQQNPYPGVLGIADAVIVTSDSVNMVSEAASTGKPVMIAYWTAETGRIAKFHQTMQRAGHTLPLAETLPEQAFVPLDETDMVRREINARLPH